MIDKRVWCSSVHYKLGNLFISVKLTGMNAVRIAVGIVVGIDFLYGSYSNRNTDLYGCYYGRYTICNTCGIDSVSGQVAPSKVVVLDPVELNIKGGAGIQLCFMPTIVDIRGLADVLKCSVQTLYKTWREYPHFYIGLGRTAKSARFNIEHVLSYLMERDYSMAQKNAISRRHGQKSYRTPYTSLQSQKGIEKVNNSDDLESLLKTFNEICKN